MNDESVRLPSDDGAERALLGSCLASPDVLLDVGELVGADDFRLPAHRVLFSSLTDYVSRFPGQGLDMIALTAFLRQEGRLEAAGGIGYISSLTSSVTTLSLAPQYAKTVREMSLRRRLIALSGSMARDAGDLRKPVVKTMDEGGAKLSDLGREDIGATDTSAAHAFAAMLQGVRKRMEDRVSGRAGEEIPSGFDDLDRMMDGGFHPTDFDVVAARPSIGKTAFALSMVRSMILSPAPRRVALFSLEMSGEQIAQRLVAAASGVSLSVIRQGLFMDSSSSAFNRMYDATSRLMASPLSIIDVPNMKLSAIRTQARKLRREKGIDIMFVDYIGLIDSEMPASSRRFEQVAEISRSLKALARELEIPVVALCQVNRDAEGDRNEPQLNNLRDSGAIEQDADMVMFLHRSRDPEQNQGRPSQDTQDTKVIIAKQRNGQTGSFHVGFRKQTASFVGYDRH